MSAGGVPKQPPTSANAATPPANTQRDAKRRTVQLEYVAPKDAPARGEVSPVSPIAPTMPLAGGRTRARGDASGPTEIPASSRQPPQVPRKEVPGSSSMPPPGQRPGNNQRTTSENAFNNYQPSSASRPNTQGTLGSARLPSRGNSYSQPAIATSTPTNAQGHFSQPTKPNSSYMMSGSGDHGADDSQPTSQQNLAQYQQQRLQQQDPQGPPPRGHKRSSTLGSIGDRILGRSNSRRASQQQDPPAVLEKRDRRYPPVSMRANIPNDAEGQPRQSTDSARRPSFGFNRKNSETTRGESKRSSRRFSFLPSGSSMSNLFGGKKDATHDPSTGLPYNTRDAARPESKGGMAFGRGASRSPSMSTTNSTIPLYYEQDREAARNQRRSGAPQQQLQQQQQQQQQSPPPRDPRYEKALPPQPQYSQPQSQSTATPPPVNRKQFRDDGYGGNLLDPARTPQPQEPVERYWTPAETLDTVQSAQSPGGYNNNNGNSSDRYESRQQPADGYGYGAQNDLYETDTQRSQQMRQPQRKFAHEYEGGNSGSSSATRKVMDFFRRRGRDRSEV